MSWQHDFAASKHQSIEEATDAYGDFLFSMDKSVEENLNGELKHILRSNIDKLNSQQLMVLQLYYVEELNVYELPKYYRFLLEEFLKLNHSYKKIEGTNRKCRRCIAPTHQITIEITHYI